MAVKFRRVKRRRRGRGRKNPVKILGKGLLFWGLAGLGAWLFVKHRQQKTLVAAATQKRLTAQIAPPAEAGDPSVTEAIQGVGGIFSGGRGFGSL
jgi:hypothetical protein